MSPPYYFCYRVASQREFTTLEALRKRGFYGVCPSVRRFRRQGQAPRAFPAMPGYIFIGLDRETDWATPLHRFSAVKAVIGGAGGVYAFSGDAIDEIERQAARLSMEEAIRHTPKRLAPGSMVRIVRGAYRDPVKAVRIEKIRGRQAILMLEFLGAEREVKVPLEAVEAA